LSQPLTETQAPTQNVPLSHRLAWVLLALVVSGIVAAAIWKRAAAVPPPPSLGVIGPFELVDQTGKTRSFKDFAGRPWIAGFMFTRCGGTCPRIVQAMTRFRDKLNDYPNLQLVCFSMDPEHDTPDVLSRYAKQQNAEHERWFFLSGKRDEIVRVTRGDFKLGIEEGIDPEEPILHSPKLVLVDERGVIRGYYDAITNEGMDELVKVLGTMARAK
jgi:protein SCO1